MDCPQLKCNVLDKSKANEKSLHMVQLLPLTMCSKYKTIQVSHQAIEHECAQRQSPLGSLPLADVDYSASMAPLMDDKFVYW